MRRRPRRTGRYTGAAEARADVSAPPFPIRRREARGGAVLHPGGDITRCANTRGIANATLSGPAVPIPGVYLIGGVGVYNSKATNAPPGITNDWNNDFAFNFGAGAEFRLTAFTTSIEARFHSIRTEGESIQFVPVVIGLKF